nr:GlsB/YeaQ/YmgE family stress response membrane protein [Klebsiella pneumoniae]
MYATLFNTKCLKVTRGRLTMGILSWIIFGLIAGIIAKWIMPGKDGGGFIVTVILGIIGAVVGGWISTLFGFGKVDVFNFGSFVVAVIGALVVLFIYRKVRS